MNLVTPSSLPLGLRLAALRERLVAMDESVALEFFQPGEFDRLLKTTVSLCPECLAHVPALVFTRQGQVWLRKLCDDHGLSDAVLENDESFYHLSNKDCWGRCFAPEKVMEFPAYAGGCGGDEGCVGVGVGADFTDQMSNKSCT